MKRFLKRLWNKFVEGFETGVWNIALFIAGLSDQADFISLQMYLPERFGVIFMALGVAGFVLRYLIKIKWIRPFNDVDMEPAQLGPQSGDRGNALPEQEAGR